MWNTWLEKGKELAASVDKKLNEAVGVEIHGGGGGTGVSTNSVTSPNFTNTSNTDLPYDDDDAPVSKDLNNAWNDDFDDDDDNGAAVKDVPSPSHAQVDFIPTENETVSKAPPTTELPMSHSDEGQHESLEEGEGWNDHHEEDLVEELDLDKSSPATPPSTIPITALPNPIETITSILTSPVTIQKQPDDDDDDNNNNNNKHQETELHSKSTAQTTVIDEPVVEETPPEAAWEEELYATEDLDDKVEKVLPMPVEMESIAVNPESSNRPITSSEPLQGLAPTSTFNGDKKHVVSDTVREEQMLSQQEEHQMAMALLQSKFDEVQHQLHLREQQLAHKATQISELESMHETERDELRKKIHETKEEAKKRIQKAKERVATMEEKLAVALKSANEDAGSQHELVAALRAEGESLARKQSEMEKAVRAAKGEARDLRESLNAEVDAKEKALERISSMEVELKTTKENLSAARKGESQAGKLETELAQSREDCERKATTILSLEQQIKELKAETKELRTEIDASKRGASIESEREMAKLRREHNETIADFELKLRTSEREAGVREDALRHEVTELRKRWQDAVRRADALSMDVQSSTAPLLRQLESMERQNRARASAWADLETKLRAELEEHVIQNEQLSKERNELRSKHTRLERISKDREEELATAKATIDELTIKTERLERKLASMEEEGHKLKEEWAEVERLANEGVARVRSEMTQTVVESEARYRSQIDSLEEELKTEKEKRRQLEMQVDELLANTGMMGPALSSQSASFFRKESKPRKLRKAEGQADILAGALNGLDGSEHVDDEDRNNPVDDSDDDDDEAEPVNGGGGAGMSSFAAMEQLNQRLAGAKFELESLRKRLAEAEKTRDALVEELSESRLAKEKLPLFEAKVKELTEENQEKEMEISGLREDIAEVRELYRNQLNMLLEEKAAAATKPEATNGGYDTSSDANEGVDLDKQPPKAPAPSEEVAGQA